MDLEALRDFIAVIKAGSFAAAARTTGTPKSTLSKRLQMLEASLGVRLIERSTRNLRLTPDGEVLHERAVGLLAEADELELLMRGRNNEPQGRLRVSVPVLFGQIHMGRLAAIFTRRWPKVVIEVEFTDRYVDLIEENFDCAIRTGPLEDSSLITRNLATSHTILIASADFMKSQQQVNTPTDILNLPTISFAPSGTPVPWLLESQEKKETIKPQSTIQLGSLHAVYMSALAGGGVALIPGMLARDALADKSIIQLLPEWHGPATNISIVYPSRHHPSARLRTFIDLLTEQITS